METTQYSFAVTVTGERGNNTHTQEYIGSLPVYNGDDPKEIAKLVAFKLYRRDYQYVAVKNIKVCYCVRSEALDKYATQWSPKNN